MQSLEQLYQVIEERRIAPFEGSYTAYLFDEGLDKILKKVGEELTEVVIAAKNTDADAFVGEISDLLYHLMVLLAEKGVSLDAIDAELMRRAERIGNKKPVHASDHES